MGDFMRKNSSATITIAGSGPSTELVSHVTIATKKRSVSSDYVFCRFPFAHNLKGRGDDTPLMIYYNRGECGCGCEKIEKYLVDSRRWDAYYKQFSKAKPSSGLCAVFGTIDRWAPKTIGLIGFDWVLDGNPGWQHDAQAEKQAILSLVNIKDLRNDSIIRRV